MNYWGKATNIKLITKLNGTHSLSFQMPNKAFNSETGEFELNEFSDYLFNERKLKLFYKNEWLEFYLKEVNEEKHFKSYMVSYTCSDAYIDELSRNGYGIIFDTELYNNVEEIGVFSEEILEDSLWTYDASYNTGDFTEYLEEKLFKIPVSYFGGKINGYKLKFDCGDKYKIKNIYTNEQRNLEIGDDLAREKQYFWDNGSFDNGFDLVSNNNYYKDIKTDGYIYVPYSQLGFCYINNTQYAATEYPAIYNGSYALSPKTVDPTALIQFMVLPQGANIKIDETGLILNKEYSYVITVKDWNDLIESNFEKPKGYLFEDVDIKTLTEEKIDRSRGNYIVSYEGYLSSINDIEISNGKKFSVSDRTEPNISEEIDQYVKVYQNNSTEYSDLFTSPDWLGETSDYRVCSKEDTRQILPELARNLAQNAVKISSKSGWEIMSLYDGNNLTINSATIEPISITDSEDKIVSQYLKYTPSNLDTFEEKYQTLINFGIIGQEKQIEKDKVYCLGIKLSDDQPEYSSNIVYIQIGQGTLISDGEYSLNNENIIKIELNNLIYENNEGYLLFKPTVTIENPYICITAIEELHVEKFYLFEAYTKGQDFFENGKYRYSGRNLFDKDIPLEKIGEGKFQSYFYNLKEPYETISQKVLFEEDIMEGSTYTYKKYFIQQLKLKDGSKAFDTFGAKKYLDSAADENTDVLPLNSGLYIEDDYDIITNYIDLNKCSYYNEEAAVNQSDCNYSNGICLYQKYGYCPYLFKTQKHCRKIRTLTGEKSNRFNLTQELSKSFEVYPVYYIYHDKNGKVIYENGKPKKIMFYITEKGIENKLGFRYEKNLSNISRSKNSSEIVTKLYVLDVDSDLSPTGLSSIRTAEDNPSKDNYIIDFSYYIKQGLLNEERTNADLYGENDNDLGFLKKLGYYNEKYDEINNKIINLKDSSYTNLDANIYTNIVSMETAQKEILKTKKEMDRYKTEEELESKTYRTYKTRYNNQRSTLQTLIENTFYTNGLCLDPSNPIPTRVSNIEPLDFLEFNGMTLQKIKEWWVDNYKYTSCGLLGQRNLEYSQIKNWRKEKEKYLAKINSISSDFFKKYEPYLKEGTWSDNNYIDNNAYYFGAKEVAKQGSIPKVSYSISLIDIGILPNNEEYIFNIADTTYIEDIGLFGINPKTGLPNRLKVIISEIEESLDEPKNNSIKVQNYTTQFEDLFQQVTASVQQLSFNENIYSRASNFTSTQNIKNESLQGALDTNELTLVKTGNNNIKIDSQGQSGTDINNQNNKYKLDGQGLFFSNNGGQSWNIGVGPEGINADYIKTGTLDASKIRIVNNDYLYFLWDKDGIIAYRDPKSINEGSYTFKDYSLFNKYGLSLVENNKIRLRAGYNFNGAANGDVNTEETTGQDIGFYLYNKNGDIIFKTESEDDISARLSLTGEMFVTNTLDKTSQEINTYSYASAADRIEVREQSFTLCDIFDDTGKVIEGVEKDGEDFNTYIINNWSSLSVGQQIIFDKVISSDYPKVGVTIRNKITSDMNYLKIEQNYYSLESYSINAVYYDINDQGEIVSIDGIEGEQYDLVLLNNNLYEKTDTKEEIYISKTNSYDLTSQKNPIKQEISTYYTLNNNIYTQNTTTDIRYWINYITGYALYNKKDTTGGEPIVEENGVVVYINNKSLNTGTTPSGFNKRILCCASKNQGNISNLFTILNNGELYIGGEIEQDINQASLSKLSDNIKVVENETTIKLSNGKITIGGQDILNNLQVAIEGDLNNIRQIVENSGLITHKHDISGAPVTTDRQTTSAGSLNAYHSNFSQFGSGEHIDIKYIAVGGEISTGSSQGTDGMAYIPLKYLVDNIELKIKEGTQTGETGSVSGGNGSLSSGLYTVRGE